MKLFKINIGKGKELSFGIQSPLLTIRNMHGNVWHMSKIYKWKYILLKEVPHSIRIWFFYKSKAGGTTSMIGCYDGRFFRILGLTICYTNYTYDWNTEKSLDKWFAKENKERKDSNGKPYWDERMISMWKKDLLNKEIE